MEFLSEKFEKLSFEEKVKVVIHELMHIPESFGGGFKHHDVVTDANVSKSYNLYLRLKENDERTDWFKLEKMRKKKKKLF